MIENLETLIALAKAGTMTAASTDLRISQSAVSKRIATLERYYGHKLIERQGRRVVLTASGTRLVEKVAPLISDLKSVFLEDQADSAGQIIAGVSDAILASWGPGVFSAVLARMGQLELTLHAHRSPVVIDRIRSGEYLVGICTGFSDTDIDLQSEVIFREPMVIVPSGLRRLDWSPGHALPVITIESHSGAWRSISEDVARLGLHRQTSVESFFAVAQMAIAGFGHGLVPRGVAATLRVDPELMIDLGGHELHRPVRFVARKSTFSRPMVQTFYQVLCERVADLDV